MATEIDQLTELTTTSDNDLLLLREASTGVDKRMRAQNLRAKATTKGDVGLGNVDNVSAADLRARSTHTGTQTLSTISDAGTAAAQPDNRYNHRANNLSDVASPIDARDNLGLGTAAVATVVTSDTDITTGRLLATTAGPAQAFRRGNILGTVSQSAGVPTGAIIERGSNSNGEFVKFADGTMICHYGVAASGSASTTWTFPAAFIGTGNVAISGTASSTGLGYTFVADAISTTSLGFSVRDSSDARQARFTRLAAIGRWY